MTRLYGVHVACNDPDNGNFARRAQALQLDFGKGDYLELGMCGRRDPGFVVLDGGFFRLGRYKYPFSGGAEWVGNWCWNAYWLRMPAIAKLIFDLMRDERWACEGGYVEACDAWDAKDGHRFMTVWTHALFPPAPVVLVGSGSPATAPE